VTPLVGDRRAAATARSASAALVEAASAISVAGAAGSTEGSVAAVVTCSPSMRAGTGTPSEASTPASAPAMAARADARRHSDTGSGR
jgi:hypothetical protein